MKQMLECIVCPASCHIQVETGADGELQISGNGCKRGAAYAKTELTAPVRMVTSTVALSGAGIARLPVVTSAPIPKAQIFPVMKEIHKIRVCAPVAVNAIIKKDLCGLGVDLLAGRSVKQTES